MTRARALRRRLPQGTCLAAVVATLGLVFTGPSGLEGAVTPAASATRSASTVAGSNCPSVPALRAALVPDGVLWDGQGGFYVSVADPVHSEVCHVSATGVLSAAAGDATAGYLPAPYGDNTTATGAELYNPAGLALDGAGNLYIADRMNDRVREVSSGTISTIAGTGAQSGALVPGTVTSAVSSTIARPSAVATDQAGNVYVADSAANQVVRLAPNGTVSVVAGSGAAGFGGDGGPALAATLHFPTGVAVDAAGDLFIADTDNDRIRMVAPGGVISTVAGTGKAGYSGDGGAATNATLRDPGGLALDTAGDLFVADSANNVVREIAKAAGAGAKIVTVAGTGVAGYAGDGGSAVLAMLSFPESVSVDSTGRVLIADAGNYRVRQVAKGKIVTVAGNGLMGRSGDGGPATSAELSEPLDVKTGPAGTYVADAWNAAVRLVSSTGVITTVAGPASGLSFPVALAVDGAGDVFVADWNNKIFEITSKGLVVLVAGTGTAGFAGDGGPALAAELDMPSGLALDPAGDLFVADSGNERIREISTTGVITTVAGTGTSGFAGDGGPALSAELNDPTALLFGPSGLYFSDRANQRIRVISSAGVVTTVAGSGLQGYTGEGLPATKEAFDFPDGLAVDATGNL
ncbi:MAG TPA: hypothetical protein VE991_11430, partial [Acidimicrobiales bacterium]|nr:hypothetical protein [Acidimicrobiales bacterium]